MRLNCVFGRDKIKILNAYGGIFLVFFCQRSRLNVSPYTMHCMIFVSLIKKRSSVNSLTILQFLCVCLLSSQEFALCLPTKPELQQPSGLSEEHSCQGSVHGRRGPQSSFAGEPQWSKVNGFYSNKNCLRHEISYLFLEK